MAHGEKIEEQTVLIIGRGWEDRVVRIINKDQNRLEDKNRQTVDRP
jgi:hypothetical protein